VVWHHSLLLMNSFNKTDVAVLSCRLCFLRAFPFIRLCTSRVNIPYCMRCTVFQRNKILKTEILVASVMIEEVNAQIEYALSGVVVVK